VTDPRGSWYAARDDVHQRNGHHPTGDETRLGRYEGMSVLPRTSTPQGVGDESLSQTADEPQTADEAAPLDVTQPVYRIPPGPDAGWSPGQSRRRVWVSRGVLLGILLVQATLSLRLHNTAFEDEALYLYAGHLQLDHLLHGGPAHPGFASYFSGSPFLYPVLGAAVDSAFGLAGARAVGLLCMLGATALLYSMSRLLFNERVGLCAAAAFAITQSTLFLGNFATFDPPAVFLLALATWIAVRGRTGRALVVCMLAASVAALAVAVKYATLLYLPTVAALAVLAAYPYRGVRALARGLLLPLLTGCVIAVALKLAGSASLAGLRFTTTHRLSGTDAATRLLLDSLRWGGPMLAVAVVGAVLYVRRERTGELPGGRGVQIRGWCGRLCLGVLLCGTALLAPAYQMHLHTGVSLHKHVGFGLLFAAPMAGVGMSRLVGAHFRRPELGILVWVTLLVLGLTQARDRYGVWPNATRMIATLGPQLRPGDHYLTGVNWVPQYYLRRQSEPTQWTSTYRISYTDREGRHLAGEAGYRAAIAEGYFDVILLDPSAAGRLDRRLATQLRASPGYRLLAALPYRNTSGHAFYRLRYDTGQCQIWVTTRPRHNS